MEYQASHGGHDYLYEVHYGEESAVARIIVRADRNGPEGLFLVKPDGSLEPADDLPGFGINPLTPSGLWPEPPAEAIENARRIAQQKSRGG